MIRKPRTSLTALLTSLSLLGLSLASAPAASATPLYDNSPLGQFFHASQSKLNAAPNGKLFGVRPVSNTVVPGSTVYQYVFKTTNSHGKAVLASSAMVVPIGVLPGANILVYDDYINSLGVHCQPSFGFNAAADTTNKLVKGKGAGYSGEIAQRNGSVFVIANVANFHKWVTIFPDFLGLESAYGANLLGGHITLDAIRAARQVRGTNLHRSKIIISGYSGGGMVAAYAAAMAPRYAPELNLVGLVSGGMPVDMTWMGNVLGNNRNAGFGIAMGTMIGMEREYPNQMNVYNRLSTKGRDIVRANRNACTPRMLASMQNESADTMFNNVILREQRHEFAVFSKNSLINYSPAPRVPMYLWSSHNDVLVPMRFITTLAKRWCTTNNKLRIQFVDTGISDHVTNASVGATMAFPWVAARFAGSPAPNNLC